MSNIRIQKIDGVEFVTYKDYLRLKEIAHDELKELKAAAETVKELEEENENLNKQIEQFKKGVKAGTNIIERLEEENKNLKSDLEQFSEAYKRYRDYEKEELAESCYDLERENKKLKDEVDFWETQATKYQKERFEQHDRIINQMKKIEELKKELQHYKITEAIQKSNADSIITYGPYGTKV